MDNNIIFDFPDAESTRKCTDESKRAITTGTLKVILRRIEESMRKGEYSCKVESSIMNSNVKSLLEEKGYKVTYFSNQRDNEYVYIIKW